MSDNKTPQASIKCVGTGLIFGEIKCPDCSRTGFGKIKDSPTPLSTEDILDSKKTVSDRKYDNWYHQHECLEAMEEYTSQQTAQLRQQVEELTNNLADCKAMLNFKKKELLFAHSTEIPTRDAEINALKERNEKMERAIKNVLMFSEPDGEIVNGYRSREVLIELKQSLNKE